jgi:hypothetical protein
MIISTWWNDKIYIARRVLATDDYKKEKRNKKGRNQHYKIMCP